MPRFALALFALVAPALLAACSSNDPPTPEPLFPGELVYAGTMTVTIRAFERCEPGGQPRLTNDETVEFQVVVSVKPPASADRDETNRLNLVVGPRDPADLETPGIVTLASAHVFETTDSRRLLQYWDLETEDGDLTGNLSNTHEAEGFAFNTLHGETPIFACQPERGLVELTWALASGATLRGTIDERGVELRLEGAAGEGSRTVVATISAGR